MKQAAISRQWGGGPQPVSDLPDNPSLHVHSAHVDSVCAPTFESSRGFLIRQSPPRSLQPVAASEHSVSPPASLTGHVFV